MTYPLAIPDSKARLFLNRIGMGYTPNQYLKMQIKASPERWLEWQLIPEQVPQNPKIAEIDSWFRFLWHTPEKIGQDHATWVRPHWTHNMEYSNWLLMRRIYSERVVEEQMAAFLNNVIHVSATDAATAPYRFDYELTIRRHALGRFEDLLVEASLHPAMRVYLENWRSLRGKPNENQGRELLELHSVSRTAGYSEAEVLDSAKILSGYTVDWGDSYQVYYDPKRHTTGPVSVLGFSDPNASSDGQDVTIRYLKYLANHSHTAMTLARRMAKYFIGDDPSAGLVDDLAATYLESGTNLSDMLRVLVRSPEFLASEGQKVRSPSFDFVAAARVLGVDAKAPISDKSYARAAQYSHGELPLNHWPRPDGTPLTNSAWASPGRVLHSVKAHHDQAGGYWPANEVTYRKASSWVPTASLPFRELVDHLCRSWLGRPADARLLSIARKATTIPLSDQVTPASFPDWQLAILGQALLSTPEHMTT